MIRKATQERFCEMLTIDVFVEDIVDNCNDDEVPVIICDYLDNINTDEDERELYLDIESGCPCLVKITQSAFVVMLERWFAYNDTNADSRVRGYFRSSDGSFMMLHGINYDWIDADLLGGCGNGQTHGLFKDFCEKSGARFNFIYD